MKRSVKIILALVAVLAAAVCLVCCFYIYQYFRGDMVNDKVDDLVGPATGQTENPSPSVSTSVPGDSSEPMEELPEWAMTVNYEALAEINPNIYAWIRIPGTPVNYAVVQHSRNDLYYNNHGVDKSYYSGGSIFSQRYNAKDFQDPVTVLYGHNRKSKTMFAPLNDFASKEVFDAHPTVYIYTPKAVYEYTIFAAYPHSSEHLMVEHDFFDEAEFNAYFGSLKDGIDTNYRRDLFPEAGDKVLTLSTCYKSNRLQRYLVQGVLTAEHPVTEG